MTRCLNESALLRLHMRESVAAERSHLRLCADCAERYERLVEDLETIGRVLEAAPPALERREARAWRAGWLPVAAAACAAVLVVVAGGVWRRGPAPVAARAGNMSAFADDLSAALFASADPSALLPLAADAPYVTAALQAGQPCTQERFFTGECNDQVSALLIEASDSDVNDMEETIQ